VLDWLITRSILILTSQRFKQGGARYRLRNAGLDLLRFQIWFHAMNRCLDFSKGLAYAYAWRPIEFRLWCARLTACDSRTGTRARRDVENPTTQDRWRGLTPSEARDFYDRIGEKQDRQGWYEDAAVRDLLVHCEFHTATSVFEFGCGTGRLAEELLTSHLPEECCYRAVDISMSMVQLARERLSRWSDRAEIELASPTIRIDARDARYDRFVSLYVLDLLSDSDIRALLVEARRVVSSGGRLCLVSLTWGQTMLSKAVSWGWARIFDWRPRLVGGCRPLALLSYLDPRDWKADYHNTVSSFGISSEVLVATAVGRPTRER